MDRRHLRTKDRVIFAHFLCKAYAVNIGRHDLTLGGIVFLACADCRNQRADTDLCSAEIIDFINFQTGIDFAGV